MVWYLNACPLLPTSGSISTSSNCVETSGSRPLARAVIATPENTRLYKRALFSAKLSMKGWPYRQPWRKSQVAIHKGGGGGAEHDEFAAFNLANSLCGFFFCSVVLMTLFFKPSTSFANFFLLFLTSPLHSAVKLLLVPATDSHITDLGLQWSPTL